MRAAMGLAICLAGCMPSAPPPKADTEAPRNAYLPAEKGPEMARVTTTADREPMAMSGAAAEVAVAWQIGDVRGRWVFPLEQASFRIGDVKTLAFPIGHIKVDPLQLTGEPAPWTRPILDRYLRDSTGAPVQVFFDVQSVGQMSGRLEGPGSTALGHVLGTIQVDSRQKEIDFMARFSRIDADHLNVDTVQPIRLDVADFHRDAQLEALTKVFGTAPAPQVELTVHLELARYDERTDHLLPTFVRTPVTLAKVTDVVKQIDDEVDDYDVLAARLAQEGVDPSKSGISRETFDKLRVGAAARYQRYVANGRVNDTRGYVMPDPTQVPGYLPPGTVLPDGTVVPGDPNNPGAKVTTFDENGNPVPAPPK